MEGKFFLILLIDEYKKLTNMISKEKKEQILHELLINANKAKAIYFANIQGVPVSDLNELRKQLNANKAEAHVYKKTLLNLAFSQSGFGEGWSDKLAGSVLVNFAWEDPLTVAKTLANFANKKEKFSLLGGVLDGKEIGQDIVKELATIPTKEVLLGRLVGSLKSPLSRLVMALNTPQQKLVFMLEAAIKTSST